MTPEQITTIRQMRDDGVRDAVIMATIGLTKGALRNIVTAYRMPPKPPTWTDPPRDAFAEMWQAGASQINIARAFGCCPNRVTKIAAKYDLEPRIGGRVDRGALAAKRTAEALELAAKRTAEALERAASRAKPVPYADVPGLDGELLRCGRNEAGRAVIAGWHGLTLTQARIKWHRLVMEYAG